LLQLFLVDRLSKLALIVGTALLALVEICIFSWIWKYNDGVYDKMFFKMHSLSERYQVNEQENEFWKNF
jgi:hypothetical protein